MNVYLHFTEKIIGRTRLESELTGGEDSGVADVGEEGGNVAEADRDPVTAKWKRQF